MDLRESELWNYFGRRLRNRIRSRKHEGKTTYYENCLFSLNKFLFISSSHATWRENNTRLKRKQNLPFSKRKPSPKIFHRVSLTLSDFLVLLYNDLIFIHFLWYERKKTVSSSWRTTSRPKFLVERQMMNDRYFWEKDINFSLASTASVRVLCVRASSMVV